MKKVIIVGFSAALLAGGFSSCAKTSKGKMSNEWTVSKMSSESTNTDSDGDKTVTTTTIDGDSGTKTTVTTIDGDSNTSTQTAAVTELSYTIEKDGTWKSVSDIAWTSTFDGGNTVTSTKSTTSGTWSFLSKNKSGDFKKNERVSFSTLSEESSSNSTTTVTFGGTTSTSTSESSSKSTYAEGESAMTYVVVESKGKELQLKADMNGSWSNTSGGTTSTNTTVGTSSMTLVQK